MAGKETSPRRCPFSGFQRRREGRHPVAVRRLLPKKIATQFAGIGFLFLDKALGELDVMTRVGFVDFAGPESNFYADARRLTGAPESF